MPDSLQESPQSQIRYRSPSSVDLQGPAADLEAAARMKKPRQQESLYDKIHRNRGIVLVIAVPLLLVVFVFYVMPHVSEPLDGARIDAGGRKVGHLKRSFAVIFDAGSSGSRVHVYCFDRNLDLLPIGKELELFVQKKPGLSSYAENPREAAESLKDLLEKAENVVPSELRRKTPVRVGATAGLRALGMDTSSKILQEVVDFLQDKSSLNSKKDWVTILDGTQEGAFQWVTINYLLGNLGKSYSSTVGVVDLGGGSVQMGYAISDEEAQNAPKTSNGEESYVKDLYLKGTTYHLYVHSYLHYGLLAARAEILKTNDAASSCILSGYHGKYNYGGKEYNASSLTSPAYTRCRAVAVKALKADEPACTHMKCTFGGVWNGGGGDGQKNLFVASFFFDRAAEAGFADPAGPVAKVKPKDFEDAARQACEYNLDDARSKYPHVEESNLPYLCMDLVYQSALLVEGFGLDPMQDITLVKKVKYGDSYVEAAWPLGSAIEVASSA